MSLLASLELFLAVKLITYSFLRDYFGLFESGSGATDKTESESGNTAFHFLPSKANMHPHSIKEKEWRNLCVKKVVEAVLEEEVEEQVECVGGGQGGVHTRQLGRQQRRHQLSHSQSAGKT
jgi:hypothetical protein